MKKSAAKVTCVFLKQLIALLPIGSTKLSNDSYKHQASLQEFSRQEYWNGLPFRSPGGLPNPEIEPGSPALQADSLPSEPPEKPPTYPTSLLHVHLPSNPNDTYLVTDAKVSVLSHLRVFAHTALCGCSTFSLSTWETSMCSLVPRVACLQTATILFLKINLIGGYFTILWRWC